jgi:hypothetical protein
LNVVLYWVFIPYRSQQRFMLQALGLAVVPLALLFDRGRWLRVLATILLGMHLLTPESWPFTSQGGSIPWDLTPSVPNEIGGLIPLFPRLEPLFPRPGHVMRPDRIANVPVMVGLLGAILTASVCMTWAWCRASEPFCEFSIRRSGGPSPRPSPEGRGSEWHRPSAWPAASGTRLLIALGATASFVAIGYADAWSEPMNARIVNYPGFADFYLGWQRMETASGPAGSHIGYAGTNIPYYLFGKNLRNQVRYINIDGHRDWLLHDYHREALSQGRGNWPNPRPGWDRSAPEFTAWLGNLDAAGIGLLVVTRVNPAEGSHNVADHEGFPIERAWADAHPDRFVPLYGRAENDPWFRLYRVRSPSGVGR